MCQEGPEANGTVRREVWASSAGIPTIHKTPYRVLTIENKFQIAVYYSDIILINIKLLYFIQNLLMNMLR